MFEKTTVATFSQRTQAESALRHLVRDGVQMRRLSIVSRNFYTEEQAVGYKSRCEVVRSWALWGLAWGWLFGILFGPFMTRLPGIGMLPGIRAVPGPTAFIITPAAWLLGSVFDAVIIGIGAGIIGALTCLWMRPNTVINYLAKEQAGEYSLLLRDKPEEVERARNLVSRYEQQAVRK